MNVEELTAIARACEEAEFRERYPDPALLVSTRAAGPGGADVDLVAVCALTDDTIPLPGRLPPTVGAPPAKTLEVAFLKNQILVGRGDECNVRLRATSVSMIHASLEPTKDGWTVTDRGSTNGTTLDGKRLRPDVPARLGDRSGIGFGPETIATFLTPGKLHALLRGS